MWVNFRTSLRRRRAPADPMAEYDRLPPEARQWLAQAALPWSPRSVGRLWRKAMRASGGDPEAARARLDALERTQLDKDRLQAKVPPR